MTHGAQLSSSILTLAIVLFGLLLMVTRSPSGALRGALSATFVLFIVFGVHIWYPYLLGALHHGVANVKGPKDAFALAMAIILGTLFFLHILLRLLFGATFAERTTSSVLSRLIYDALRLIFLFITSIFRGIRRILL